MGSLWKLTCFCKDWTVKVAEVFSVNECFTQYDFLVWSLTSSRRNIDNTLCVDVAPASDVHKLRHVSLVLCLSVVFMCSFNYFAAR